MQFGLEKIISLSGAAGPKDLEFDRDPDRGGGIISQNPAGVVLDWVLSFKLASPPPDDSGDVSFVMEATGASPLIHKRQVYIRTSTETVDSSTEASTDLVVNSPSYSFQKFSIFLFNLLGRRLN